MNIIAKRSRLHGSIQVPGSKSHTIRALLLAALAEGTSHIKNPLASADCLSAAAAIPLLGARVELGDDVWTVRGAGKASHLPEDVVNVGNSGSLLYFMSPVAATFEGISVFTGDESIRRRPVLHVVDALNQLGAKARVTRPGGQCCPLVIQGPITCQNTVRAGGELSQYISGLMMAATRMDGTLNIELSNPKETPYLSMTRLWLESLGVSVSVSEDFKHIQVTGPVLISAFDRTIPSDWEAVAFPLVACTLAGGEIQIPSVDTSGSQGDEAIVDVLRSVGADIELDGTTRTLTVRGGARLSTEGLPGEELHVNLSGFPDAVCALAVAACFVEGKTYIEDIGVCRKKECDRIKVLSTELSKLGADITEGSDCLVIQGHSPLLPSGEANPAFCLHGGEVESYHDHRVAMAAACMGLALPQGEQLVVRDGQCCAVSFPGFVDAMNAIGAGFTQEG